MATVTEPKPRTYRIVGPQQRVDERDTPHPRVERGELGERLRAWRDMGAASDPFMRIFASNRAADPNNCLQQVMRGVPEGAVNPQRTPVPDPEAMAKQIKEIARYFGADVVGITHLDQAYVYSHRARGCAEMGEKPGDPIHLPHRFAICLGFASDYDRYMSHNSHICDAEYMLGNIHTIQPTFLLAAYIRELGYPARAHYYGRSEVNPLPLAVNAGLGELGRHGMLIHEEYGPRLHLAVVTTDLPLVTDHPVDIVVEDFCKLCMKCARTCPSHSITFGDKEVVNGVEKWRINVDTCYKYRLATRDQWFNCLTCVTVCCYNKREYVWYHTLAMLMLKRTPIPLRPLVIVPLLWMDDLIWGKRPWRRMRWLDYDSAPVAPNCRVRGCQAHHGTVLEKRLHRPPGPAARSGWRLAFSFARKGIPLWQDPSKGK